MALEIVNVREDPMNNKEILTRVDIETSPRIRQLDMGIQRPQIDRVFLGLVLSSDDWTK